MFNRDDYEYSCHWSEEDNCLIEWYERKRTGECLDADEFFKISRGLNHENNN